MASMLVDAKLAIKGLIDLAAVFNLLIFMFLTIEFSRIVVEVLDLIQNALLELFFLRVRLKLLKRLHGVIVLRMSCW